MLQFSIPVQPSISFSISHLQKAAVPIYSDTTAYIVTCSHHLNHRFWSGGFLLNGSTEPSIYKLSSRAPRFIFTQLWDIFIVWIQTLPIYPANNIRRASSRILIAAFRSRSIRFPHVQRYTLSDSFSSFFILPHLQHFLLEGKKRSTHTNLFPLHVSLYSSNSRNFP